MSTIKCMLHGKFSWGDETRNVFYWQGDYAVVANGQAILDELIAIILGDTAAFVDDYAFIGGTFYDFLTPGVPGAFYTPTGGDKAGTAAGDPLPGQIATLTNFWAHDVRPNRKRTYWAGAAEGFVTAGLWEQAHLDRLDDVGQGLIDFDASLGEDCNFCTVWVDEVEEVVWANNLTQFRNEAVPATQRRRRRGTGI